MNGADEISQAERRRILAEDRRAKHTYYSVAQGSIDDDRGGRYAVTTPTSVVGAPPIQYPKQPEGSPWANEPIGPEPFIDGRAEGDKYEWDAADQAGRQTTGSKD